MACLEHECTVCGWRGMDNNRRLEGCPICGGRLSTIFDEDVHQHEREEDETEDDERQDSS